jgi:hypothetical protein
VPFLISLALAPAADAARRPPNALPAIQIRPSPKLVEFQQAIFDVNGTRVADTDWGLFQANPKLFKQLGRLADRGTGYLNVFLFDPSRSAGSFWVVDNLHIAADPGSEAPPSPQAQALRAGPRSDEALPINTFIDLRPGQEGSGPLERLQAVVLFSNHPLPVAARIQELAEEFEPDAFSVEPAIVDEQGDLGESGAPPPSGPPAGTLLALIGGPPPQPLSPLPDLPGPGDLAFPIVVTQTPQPNVQTAVNQCGPMAMANAVKYLEDRYDAVPLSWNVPHLPISGLGRLQAGDVIAWNPVPDTSLVAWIDSRTRRLGAVNSESGDGASRCKITNGLISYLATFGGQASVTLRHQGGSATLGEDSSCDDDDITLPLGGIVSNEEGGQPTWEWIFGELQAGRAVTIAYGRYDVSGVRTGGHVVRVWGAALYNNKRFIYTLDDGNQGANLSGLQTKSWEVKDIGTPGLLGVLDGRLNMGGTSRELEFALSIEAHPTLNIP